jgi:hypothetical protein
LSDERLTELLQEKGYNIARRTVAKYREHLNIPVGQASKRIITASMDTANGTGQQKGAAGNTFHPALQFAGPTRIYIISSAFFTCLCFVVFNVYNPAFYGLDARDKLFLLIVFL